ncbi:MAG: TolC family protein [Bryobacteraceae bacterium]
MLRSLIKQTRPPLAMALAALLTLAPLVNAQQPATNNQAPKSSAPEATSYNPFATTTSPYGQGRDPAALGPVKPHENVLIRPYSPAIAPDARLGNSGRMRDLIRGGNLYLTVQDAVALAIENNIDLEVDRYNPILSAWAIQRAQAGGAARGVTGASLTSGNSVTSGQGVAGSQASAGVSTTGNSKSSISNANATVSQIGPITQVLDPVVQDLSFWGHTTIPQNNTLQSGTTALIDGKRVTSASISQGTLTGGTVTLSGNASYLNENALSDTLNPTDAGSLSLSIQQNLLQNFGRAVNARSITVAKSNLQISDIAFKAALITVVATVLTQYYQLVSDREDTAAKRSALILARQLESDNKRQVDIGTLAPIEITRAEAQVATAEQDLTVSETTLLQEEVTIKNLLSRNGLAEPLLVNVRVIPLDTIRVPDTDDLPSIQTLVGQAVGTGTGIPANAGSNPSLTTQATAPGAAATGVQPPANQAAQSANPRPNLQGPAANTPAAPVGPPAPVTMSSLIGSAVANRTDIQTDAMNYANAVVSAIGTRNGVLPSLQVFATLTQNGLNGSVNQKSLAAGYPPPDSYFVGGYGTQLGQIFRRNFPSDRGGFAFTATVRNRTAQADEAIDQLQLRQSEINNARDKNQVAVLVSNAVIGLRQARTRYAAAVKNRILEEQLLDAEQKKFQLGTSTPYNVITQQRDLATARSSEVTAQATYAQAKILLDQVLGITLETNHVSIGDATVGHVAFNSVLPEKLPADAANPQ